MSTAIHATTSTIPWQQQQLAATEYIPENKLCDVLIMHGAGQASQELTKTLAQEFAKKGCRAIVFDYVGHGQSTGTVQDLTLSNRSKQAQAIYKHYRLSPDCTVVGFSMSGQTAVDLLHALQGNIRCLALFAPAVYDAAARDAHFGPDFSQFIRRPQSWRNTDAWHKLASYHGKLVTFESPHDTVIPVEVLQLLHTSAIQANPRLRIRLADAPHTMARWMTDNPTLARWFADTIYRFANSNASPDEQLAATLGITFDIL